MDVFFMIFGFFIVFLMIFICLMTIFFGSKKNSSSPNAEMLKEPSEFEKVLKDKQKKSVSLEERIQKMNQAEQEANSIIRKNEFGKIKSVLEDHLDDNLSMKNDQDYAKNNPKRENVQTLLENNNKNAKPGQYQPYIPRKNGKIQGHRNSRSLVTVEKSKDDLLFQTIENMESSGMSIQEIAKKLGRGIREIEIIKRLNEKS